MMAAIATEKAEFLENIKVKPDVAKIRRRLQFHKFKISDNQSIENRLQFLIADASLRTSPRAIYKICQINHKTNDSVAIDGKRFTNYLLKVNLDNADKVFVYAASCNPEAETSLSEANREMESYLRQVIGETLVAETEQYLRDYLIQRYRLNLLWSLSPGQYQAWPASDRRPLLDLFSGAQESIGIKVAPDGGLVPPFSALGLFYYSQIEPEKCQFCSRVCVGGRRAPYNPELASKFPEIAARGGCAR